MTTTTFDPDHGNDSDKRTKRDEEFSHRSTPKPPND